MSGNLNMYSCRGPYLICVLSKLPELGLTTLFVLDFATSTAHRRVEVSVHAVLFVCRSLLPVISFFFFFCFQLPVVQPQGIPGSRVNPHSVFL